MSGSGIMVGIVTFNRLHKLVRTLEECRRQGFTHIVVVDNGSTDGTREFLKEQKDITSIFSEQNLGGSGGFNCIMRYFYTQTSHDLLLTMDDDAWPGFSEEDMLQYIAGLPKKYPAYVCRVVYPDGALCEMNRPGLNILTRLPFLHAQRDLHIHEDSSQQLVDFAGFVGLVIRRDTIGNTGVVSKKFFIYSDDTYYTLSVSRSIGKLLYCPEFTFYHDCKRSSRNFVHHDKTRLEKDLINKIVLIREFSAYKSLYIALYLLRSIAMNPRFTWSILRASRQGIITDISPYRNESL